MWRGFPSHSKSGKSNFKVFVDKITMSKQLSFVAADYQNEAEVREALADAFQTGLVKREDLFITTKLWNSDHGHVLEACKDSLKKLRLDYLDLYLVQFPVATKNTDLTSQMLVRDLIPSVPSLDSPGQVQFMIGDCEAAGNAFLFS
ncbi:NADP-dependent D-sorbitol-6-phosphate dehydrogenase-like [Spinacia oleracea]|uniref:NADP-dependent D-sorbitol-6-phosphate dehydrogenase-like n=2 Tax=Spinacia oleracea TaxID=3562 RepID=A0ABM3QYI5_SPIOL|nr:NADP-dependent D-sorbitol-6-phosphate dehydrogenase-like [Spinacia oleracea]